MPNFFFIMLAFLALAAPHADPAPLSGPLPVALALFAFVGLPALFGLTASVALRYAMAQPASRFAAFCFRRARTILLLHKVSILALFFLFCQATFWPRFVGKITGGVPVLTSFVQILPFLLSLALFWAIAYAVESTLGIRRGSFREQFVFNLRHAGLPVTAICLIHGIERALLGAPEEWQLVLPLTLFIFFPLLMRIIWPVEPLPAGNLRTSLDRMRRDNRVRILNVLRWKTGPRRVMNACMIGFVPWVRYILMTDALMERLEEEEVQAVFGHELCHAKRHHVVFYALYLSTLFLLMGAPLPEPAYTISMTVLSVGWFFSFGWISRRFERECDLFGARAVGSHGAFIRALQKISPAPGGMRWLRTFLHDDLETRVGFLAAAEADPGQADRFLRQVRFVRAGILLLFALGFALAVMFEVSG